MMFDYLRQCGATVGRTVFSVKMRLNVRRRRSVRKGCSNVKTRSALRKACIVTIVMIVRINRTSSIAMVENENVAASTNSNARTESASTILADAIIFLTVQMAATKRTALPIPALNYPSGMINYVVKSN